MLLRWIDRLLASWPSLSANGLDAVALRAVLAAAAALTVSLVCGPHVVRWLKKHFREPIKSASAEVARLHQEKASTPTMGGLLIVGALLCACLAFADLQNPYVWLAMLLTLALAALGACDDLVKLSTVARGLTARTKLAAQVGIALVAALLVHHLHSGQPHGLELAAAWGPTLDLGWWFVPLAVLVIVGSSNAVNLTDGLDGLAAGCLVCAALAMSLAAYLGGQVACAGEMAVIGGGLVGALLGFLWFNCHPASVFMGDTGSLPLGGLIGLMAVVSRQELLLAVVAGVFVVETASVIVQVASYRWRKRRVLLCAPLHHHFQLRGWTEDKIVVRFWIAGALCAVVGLAGLRWQSRALPAAAQISAAQQVTR